jgi:hypothetical protein
MADKTPAHSEKSTNRGPISLAPLTPEQALSAALRVKKSDVDKLEAEEKASKAKRKRASKK